MFGKKDPAGDDVFLRLDATNDPLTGGLLINSAGVEDLLDLQFNSVSKVSVDNRGVMVLRPDNGLTDTPALDLASVHTLGFFQQLTAASISAIHTGAFGLSTALKLHSQGPSGSEYINMTGGAGPLINYTGTDLSVQLNGVGSLIMKNAQTVFSATMLDLEISGAAVGSNFLKLVSQNRVEFQVDRDGNMLVAGATINPRGTTGTFNNEALFSEQISQAGTWVPTNMTVTPNFAPGPDGTPNAADRVQNTATDGNIIQTFSAFTAANNTFTASMWGLRETTGIGSTLRYEIEDSTGAESSPTEGIGLIGQEDKWEFHSLTYTFSGAATGSPRLRIFFQTSGNAGQVWGVNFTQTDGVVGYSPTQDAAVPLLHGGVVNGQLLISAGKGPTWEVIRVSNDQGATPCFITQNTIGITQFGIAANGRDFELDTVIGTKIGTAVGQKLGFWNAAPIVQPTVTGSRAGNAALASLLTQLATMGLVVDTTTA